MSESLIADQYQPADHAGFVYPALLYTDTADYLAGTLVLVNQLCDLVRIHTRLGATTVRIQLRR